jgi:hypothetical protein
VKIIFYGGLPAHSADALDWGELCGTQHTYSYFLRKELAKRGIQSDMFGFSTLDKKPDKIPEGDHLISVSQRGITNATTRIPDARKRVEAKIKGKITSICDFYWDGHVEEDMIFFARPHKDTEKHKYVGWAACPKMLHPDKKANEIRILIDHTLYVDTSEDSSSSVISQCMRFKENFGLPVTVRRFISGGVETVITDNQIPTIYTRKGLPFPEACEEYNKANIFITTHAESMGLSVLESAMADTLVVTKKGYIGMDLLHDLNYVEHEGEIDWNEVIRKAVPGMSRVRAIKYNWVSVVDKILEHLK